MKRHKRLILISAAAALVLVFATVGGIAYAQTTTPGGSGQTLMARVAAILGIDQQKVQDAFTQAQKEMRDEALDSRLKSQVERGRMTQEQADQYKQWLNSAPDMSQYNQQLKDWGKTRPAIPPEFKQWQDARPDMPMGPGFGGMGLRGRFGPGPGPRMMK